MDIVVYADPNRPDLRVVKCVVVGDTGVGKTRLICTQACGTQYSLQQLCQTHVPTVWAIDHYRKDREVLEKSWQVVDGVSVSLRLWDTFGYHDKDRRFAYGRADVVLVCFSTVRPRSLRNVLNVWYPEICRCCPGVPIILCGCQVDLRYLFMDDEFLKLDKGPFFREIMEQDILTPDKGRAVAKEMGAAYYETSVLEYYGIHELFTNVVRAALSYKRDKHFWTMLGNLKRILRPQCQAPFLPPKPPTPNVQVYSPKLERNLTQLLNNQAYCDVIFVARGVCVQAHKIVLVAASQVFQKLFLTDFACPATDKPPPGENHDNSKVTCIHDNANGNKGIGKQNGASKVLSDTAKLLDNEEINSSVETLNTEANIGPQSLPQRTLNHPAFHSIQLQHCDDVFNPGCRILQTVVTLNDNITPTAFQHVLHYLYTGMFGGNSTNGSETDILLNTLRAADLIGLPDLVTMVTNLINFEPYLNKDLEEKFQIQQERQLKDLVIKKGVLSDVVFRVDDGCVAAHKALLTLRCDVMLGMFSYNFMESSAKVIEFPGVTRETFTALQYYLYTGQCPDLHDADCMELIALANRLCLPHLLSLLESYVTEELMRAQNIGQDIYEEAVMLWEPAQLHNASQLAAWCQWFICSNYTAIYRRYSKLIQSLKPENQILLSRQRWPPLWYLKEWEYYEKMQVDQEREKSRNTHVRRGSDDLDRGCLGFCGRNRRKLKCDSTPAATVAT